MAEITVSSFPIPDLQFEGVEAGELRLYASRTFLDSDGEIHLGGAEGDQQGFYQACPFTVADGVITVASFVTTSTLDAQDNAPSTILISGVLFSADGQFLQNLFSGWQIPTTTPTIFATLYNLNRSTTFPIAPVNLVTQQQMVDYVASVLGDQAYASDVIAGKTYLTQAPVLSTHPTAVGSNDYAGLTNKGITALTRAPVVASSPSALASNDQRVVKLTSMVGDAVKIEDAAINVSTSTTTLTSASSTFTSALVGKTIVVAGAGSAGGTLTSVISAVPTTHTLTLATPASTTVSSKRAVYGTANSTTTLQAELDALAASAIASYASPVLYIPPGNYLFTSGSISIPPPVTLQGSWENSPRFLGYAYSGEPTIMDGTGTSFIITASEGTSTGRFILVNSNASLRGCAFFYPMELASLSTPKVYPWTIELTGSCPSLEHCNTYNGYQSVYVHITESPRVYDVQGQPILLGMYTSQVLDSAYFREVHFVPQYTYNEGGSITALQTWMSANGTAFKIGRVDDASFEDCFSFGYYKGFYFVNDAPETTPYLDGNGAPGGSAWCHFHGGGADQTNYPVDVAQCQGVLSGGVTTVNGVTFDHSVFTAAQVVPIGGISPICVLVEATLTGHVLLNGCGFVGGQGVFTQALAAGKVDINACYFQVSGGAYKVRAEGATAIEMTGNRFISNTVGSIQGIGARIFQSGNVFADTGTLYAVTFQNSWVNEGSYPNVTYEIRDGRVYLHGAAKNGTMGAVAFTLPTGFLIAATALFPAYSSPSIGGIQIATDGTVLIGSASGSNAIVGFDGISFEVP